MSRSIERLVEHLSDAWKNYELDKEENDDESILSGLRESLVIALNDLAEEIEDAGEQLDLPPAQVVASFFAE